MTHDILWSDLIMLCAATFATGMRRGCPLPHATSTRLSLLTLHLATLGTATWGTWLMLAAALAAVSTGTPTETFAALGTLALFARLVFTNGRDLIHECRSAPRKRNAWGLPDDDDD